MGGKSVGYYSDRNFFICLIKPSCCSCMIIKKMFPTNFYNPGLTHIKTSLPVEIQYCARRQDGDSVAMTLIQDIWFHGFCVLVVFHVHRKKTAGWTKLWLGMLSVRIKVLRNRETTNFKWQSCKCTDVTAIDLFHKWRPIKYSYIFMKISLTTLFSMCKIH